MLTKTITYENYNGEKKTKNFYFHFSNMELGRMEVEYEGGIRGHIKKIIETNDNKEIFKIFEEIVLSAYGERSADGEEFLKSPEIKNSFKCHPAYDVLMLEIINGGEKAMADFINAVVPKEISKQFANVDVRKEAKDLVGFDVVS